MKSGVRFSCDWEAKRFLTKNWTIPTLKMKKILKMRIQKGLMKKI